MTGGCQCGAVRFRVDGALGRASICHCRMCQNAFGAFFGPLVSAPGVAWTRGAPRHFASSNLARRGFCAACGTPLTYEPRGGPIEIAIGAFDAPQAIIPVIQHAVESAHPAFASLPGLPVRTAAEAKAAAPHYAAVRSNQHPDHDT